GMSSGSPAGWQRPSSSCVSPGPQGKPASFGPTAGGAPQPKRRAASAARSKVSLLIMKILLLLGDRSKTACHAARSTRSRRTEGLGRLDAHAHRLALAVRLRAAARVAALVVERESSPHVLLPLDIERAAHQGIRGERNRAAEVGERGPRARL